MVHIQIALTLISLIGFAVTVRDKFNTSFSNALFYGVIGISILLYIGGLLDYLEIVVNSIRFIGWIGLLVSFARIKKIQLTEPEVFLIISTTVFYVFCQSASYSIYPFIDDYSHWGRMSRYISENNRLIINEDLIGVKDYPPIAALFHYFFTYFTGHQDNIAIFANGLLLIIFSSPLFISIKHYREKERKFAFVLTALVIYSLYWVFGLGLHSLWADLLLGFSFGLSLHVYFNQEKENKKLALLSIIPLLLYTVQIKQIGILFAFFTLTIVGIDYLKNRRTDTVKSMATLAFIALALILFEWTWKNYLATHGIDRIFKADISVSNILSAINPATASNRHSITISRFIDHIFFTHHLSTYWFIGTLLIFGGIIQINKINHLQAKITPFILAYLLFAAYLIILLILYLFSFGDYEGTRLASIERYMVTYILGLIIFMGGAFINAGTLEKSKKIAIYFIVVGVFLILPNIGRIIIDTLKVGLNKEPRNEAAVIKNISDYVRAKTPENSKIYIIWSEGSNDESVIFSYYLIPRQNNSECIFIKPPLSLKSGDDIWSCTMTIEEFKQKLVGYDYILIANPSVEFINYYLQNLNIAYNPYNSILFQIVGDKEMTFQKIQ